jgi:hypothetical protein
VIVAIPEGWMPLAVGTLLVLGGLSLVLWPLITHDGSAPPPARDKAAREDADAEEASDGAVAALREIEFDRATGKLSDTDYTELKTRYTKAALAELRGAEAVPVPVLAPAVEESDASLDPVEAAIRRAKANQKSCVVCGPRSEPDAIYCSSCGRYLPGACGRCGASVALVGSRFCTSCGEHLAAA